MGGAQHALHHTERSILRDGLRQCRYVTPAAPVGLAGDGNGFRCAHALMMFHQLFCVKVSRAAVFDLAHQSPANESVTQGVRLVHIQAKVSPLSIDGLAADRAVALPRTLTISRRPSRDAVAPCRSRADASPRAMPKVRELMPDRPRLARNGPCYRFPICR